MRRPLLAGLLGLLLPPLATSRPGAAQEAGVLRLVAPTEISGLEPWRSGAIFARMGVMETLLAADATGQPIAALAERWSVDGAGLAWQFMLRPGLQFHDGTAVSGAAVADSLRRAQAEATPLARAPIAGIEAAGGTVIIRLHRPFAALPAFLAHSASGILAPAAYDSEGRVRAVIGSGPYRVVALTQPMRLEVARFDAWWGERPAIERAVYLVAGQGEMRALMAESGQADIVFSVQPVTVARLRRNPKLDMRLVSIPRTRMLKLNLAAPLLADLRVRQALSLAIDRQGIATALLRNPALAANQLLPPAFPEWHIPDLPPPRRDLDAARRLLAAAGWQPGADGMVRNAAGQPFRALLRSFATWPELPPIATALQAQFREIGLDIAIAIGNASDIPLGHRDGTLEMGLMSRNYALVPDPLGAIITDFAPEGSDWGAMNWSSRELTAALERMDGSETPAARVALRRRVSAILQAELPVIPIVWSELGVAIGRRVTGVTVDPFETSYRLQDIRWAGR